MCSLQANATAQAAPTRTHYRGVRKRSENRFCAQIRDPSKRRRVWLGTFSSDIEAAHAYDRAARAMKGCKAITNFPLSGYQHPTPVRKSAAYQNPKPVPNRGSLSREKLKESAQKRHVPSWRNSNKLPKAASRPWTHAYLTKSFNVGTSSSSFLEAPFPLELQRRQQLAALKISNRPRCNENEGDGAVGEIRAGHKESCRPCNSSDPPSSGVTESTNSLRKAVLDLNFPPPVERDECGHLHSDENSIKTLWLLK